MIGSERPVPRLSKVMMRPTEVSRCHTLDANGDSQLISRCEGPYTRSRCRRCACSECQRSSRTRCTRFAQLASAFFDISPLITRGGRLSHHATGHEHGKAQAHGAQLGREFPIGQSAYG